MFVAGLRGARVKLDGKEIAGLGGSGSAVLDVAAGSHEVTADVWDHPNVYRLKLDAKPGMLYTLEITARADSAATGVAFGMAGILAEAAANENSGVFQIRVIDVMPVKS